MTLLAALALRHKSKRPRTSSNSITISNINYPVSDSDPEDNFETTKHDTHDLRTRLLSTPSGRENVHMGLDHKMSERTMELERRSWLLGAGYTIGPCFIDLLEFWRYCECCSIMYHLCGCGAKKNVRELCEGTAVLR